MSSMVSSLANNPQGNRWRSPDCSLFTRATPAQAQPSALADPLGPTSGYRQVPSAGVLNPASHPSPSKAWVTRHRSRRLQQHPSQELDAGLVGGLCGTTCVPTSGIRLDQHRGARFPHLPGRREDPGRQWTHVAGDLDGTTRSHYINGELGLHCVEPGALPATSDVSASGAT